MACKDKCKRLSDAVTYKNRKRYKIGITGVKCSVCEIHLPIGSRNIRYGKNGCKICSCCGMKLSSRINDKKEYVEKLVLDGVVMRY